MIPKSDLNEHAVYAAGIADSLACIDRTEPEAASRFNLIVQEFGGSVAIMEQIAEAAVTMERFRSHCGSSSTWGGDLPYLYDVWDAIARTIYTQLGTDTLENLINTTIRDLMCSKDLQLKQIP